MSAQRPRTGDKSAASSTGTWRLILPDAAAPARSGGSSQRARKNKHAGATKASASPYAGAAQSQGPGSPEQDDALALPATDLSLKQRREFRAQRRKKRQQKRSATGVVPQSRSVHHSAPGVRDLDGDATWKPEMPMPQKPEESFLPDPLRSRAAKRELVRDNKEQRLTGTWIDRGVQKRNAAHKAVRTAAARQLESLQQQLSERSESLADAAVPRAHRPKLADLILTAQRNLDSAFSRCHCEKHVLTDKMLTNLNRSVRNRLSAADQSVQAVHAQFAESLETYKGMQSHTVKEFEQSRQQTIERFKDLSVRLEHGVQATLAAFPQFVSLAAANQSGPSRNKPGDAKWQSAAQRVEAVAQDLDDAHDTAANHDVIEDPPALDEFMLWAEETHSRLGAQVQDLVEELEQKCTAADKEANAWLQRAQEAERTLREAYERVGGGVDQQHLIESENSAHKSVLSNAVDPTATTWTALQNRCREHFDSLAAEFVRVEAALSTRPVQCLGRALCGGVAFCVAASNETKLFSRASDSSFANLVAAVHDLACDKRVASVGLVQGQINSLRYSQRLLDTFLLSAPTLTDLVHTVCETQQQSSNQEDNAGANSGDAELLRPGTLLARSNDSVAGYGVILLDDEHRVFVEWLDSCAVGVDTAFNSAMVQQVPLPALLRQGLILPLTPARYCASLETRRQTYTREELDELVASNAVVVVTSSSSSSSTHAGSKVTVAAATEGSEFYARRNPRYNWTLRVGQRVRTTPRRPRKKTASSAQARDDVPGPAVVFGTVQDIFEPSDGGEVCFCVEWDGGYRPAAAAASAKASDTEHRLPRTILQHGRQVTLHSLLRDWVSTHATVKPVLSEGTLVSIVQRDPESGKILRLLPQHGEVTHVGPPMKRETVLVSLVSPGTSAVKQSSSGDDEAVSDPRPHERSIVLTVAAANILVLAHPRTLFPGARVRARQDTLASQQDSVQQPSTESAHARFGSVVGHTSSAIEIQWDNEPSRRELISKAPLFEEVRRVFLEFGGRVPPMQWKPSLFDDPEAASTVTSDAQWHVADVDAETLSVQLKDLDSADEATVLYLNMGLGSGLLRNARNETISQQTFVIDAPEFNGLPKDIPLQGDGLARFFLDSDCEAWSEALVQQFVEVDVLVDWDYHRRCQSLFVEVQDAWEVVLVEAMRRKTEVFRRKVYAAMRNVRVAALQAEWSEFVRRSPAAQERIAHSFRLAACAEQEIKPLVSFEGMRMPRISPHTPHGRGASPSSTCFDESNGPRLRSHLEFQKSFFETAGNARLAKAQTLLDEIQRSIDRINEEVDRLAVEAFAQTRLFVDTAHSSRDAAQGAKAVVEENKGLLESVDQHDKESGKDAPPKAVASLNEGVLDPQSDAAVAAMVGALANTHDRVQALETVFKSLMPPPRIALRQGFASYNAELQKLMSLSKRSLASASVFLRLPQKRNAKRYRQWESRFTKRARLLAQLQSSITQIADQFLSIVDRQQHHVLQSNLLRRTVALEKEIERSDAIDNSGKAEPQHPESGLPAVKTATIEECLEHVEAAIASAQAAFDLFQSTVEEHFSGGKFSEHGDAPLEAKGLEQAQGDVESKLADTQTALAHANSVLDDATGVVTRTQTNADIAVLWTEAFSRSLSSTKHAGVAELQDQLGATLAKAWANPHGLSDIPHVSQMLTQIQNELAGLRSWDADWTGASVRSGFGPLVETGDLADTVASSIVRFSEVRRHVDMTSKLITLESCILQELVHLEASKRLELQAYLDPIQAVLDSVQSRLGTGNSKQDNDAVAAGDVPVLQTLHQESVEELGQLRTVLAKRAATRLFASRVALEQHVETLCDRVADLVINCVSLDHCVCVASGLSHCTNLKFVEAPAQELLGNAPDGDLPFRHGWRKRLERRLSEVSGLLTKVDESDELQQKMENVQAVRDYLQALCHNIKTCITECSTSQGANTHFARMLLLIRAALERCDETESPARPARSPNAASAKLPSSQYLAKARSKKLRAYQKQIRSLARNLSTSNDQGNGQTMPSSEYVGFLVSFFLFREDGTSVSRDVITKAQARVCQQGGPPPISCLSDALIDINCDYAEASSKYSNVMSFASNVRRILPLQKRLLSVHMNTLSVDQLYRELVEVALAYGLGMDFHHLRTLGRGVIATLEKVYSLAHNFHAVIASDDSIDSAISSLSDSVRNLRILHMEVAAAITAEKARRDDIHNIAARRIQTHARGLLARVHVRRLIFERVLAEQRERETIAAVQVQLLARMFRARRVAAGVLHSLLEREAKVAAEDAADARRESRWNRFHEPRARKHFYRHSVSQRVTFVKPEDFEDPMHRFAAWRVAAIDGWDGATSTPREADIDDDMETAEQRPLYVDVWSGALVWSRPAEFRDDYSCCSPAPWLMQWKNSTQTPLFVCNAEVQAADRQKWSHESADKLVMFEEPGGYVPLVAQCGLGVELLRVLESGQRYWHRGVVTRVYARDSQHTFEYDICLECTVERRRKGLQPQTIHRVHGRRIRRLYARDSAVRVELSAYKWQDGTVVEVTPNGDDGGACYKVEVVVGEKVKHLTCNASRLMPQLATQHTSLIGVKCRFRPTFGSWEAAEVVAVDDDGFCTVFHNVSEETVPFYRHMSELHVALADGAHVEVYRFDTNLWIKGRVQEFADDGTYVVEIDCPSEMDAKRNSRRRRYLRQVANNLIRKVDALTATANDEQSQLLPALIDEELSAFDGPNTHSSALYDGFKVQFCGDAAELNVFCDNAVVVNCRYDGTYDVEVNDRESSNRANLRVIRGVPRHKLALRFVRGDRVKFKMEVMQVDDQSDDTISASEWVAGVVCGPSKSGEGPNGVAGYEICPLEGDLSDYDLLSKVSSEALDTVNKSVTDIWPIVALKTYQLRPFLPGDVVNICTVEANGTANWSFDSRATVVTVVDVECAGNAVAILQSSSSGRVFAVDVAHLQLYFSLGRPVSCRNANDEWVPGFIQALAVEDGASIYLVEVDEASGQPDVTVPLAAAATRLKPRVPDGCLIKVWNSLLGEWQVAEVLSSAVDDKGQLFVEAFRERSRTIVVPVEQTRSVPQQELDKIMYRHAVQLQAIDVHARTDSVKPDHLASLTQALQSGADANYTCTLPANTEPPSRKLSDAVANVEVGDLVDDGAASAAATLAASSFSALHVACGEGLDDAVKVLLDFGADMSAKNEAGLTPMHLASMHGHHKCIRSLLKHVEADDSETSSNVNAVTWMGETPLFYAVQQGFLDAAEILIAAKADTNLCRTDGCTPLMIAVSERLHSVVELLLGVPATDATLVSQSGWSAQSLATGDAKLVELLATATPSSNSASGSAQSAPDGDEAAQIQHFQNGWPVFVRLPGNTLSDGSTAWNEAVVMASDPLGNFTVQLAVGRGNIATSRGLPSQFVPADVLEEGMKRRRRIVRGDRHHMHLRLKAGDFVRCNPDSGRSIAQHQAKARGNNDVRSWLSGVVLESNHSIANDSSDGTPPVPKVTVAVTEGKRRGQLLRDIPCFTWNVHPRSAGDPASNLKQAVDVCVDGAHMWVPFSDSQAKALNPTALAPPSQVRRAFARGDAVTIFSDDSNDKIGVVVGPTDPSEAPDAASRFDVLVGDVEPTVSFDRLGDLRHATTPSREVRSIKVSSIFHGRPRFSNGISVTVVGERDDESCKSTESTESNEVYLVDHAFEGLNAYELSSIARPRDQLRVRGDQLAMFLRRGDQVLAFINAEWTPCIVSETCSLSFETEETSARVVPLLSHASLLNTDNVRFGARQRVVSVPYGLITPVISVPQPGMALSVTQRGASVAQVNYEVGNKHTVDSVERSEYRSEISMRLTGLSGASLRPHSRILFGAGISLGARIRFSLGGFCFDGVVFALSATTVSAVIPHSPFASKKMPLPLLNSIVPMTNAFDPGIPINQATGAHVLASRECRWALAIDIESDFVWPDLASFELGQAVIHVNGSDVRACTIEKFIEDSDESACMVKYSAESSDAETSAEAEQQAVNVADLLPDFHAGSVVLAFDVTSRQWVAGVVIQNPGLSRAAVHVLTTAPKCSVRLLRDVHPHLVKAFPISHRFFFPGSNVVQTEAKESSASGDIMAIKVESDTTASVIQQLLIDYSPDVVVGPTADGKGHFIFDSLDFGVIATHYGPTAQQVKASIFRDGCSHGLSF